MVVIALVTMLKKLWLLLPLLHCYKEVINGCYFPCCNVKKVINDYYCPCYNVKEVIDGYYCPVLQCRRNA